jgi:antitoxin MazE
MVTKVQKWGNSQGLRFPKSILDEAKIGVGDEVTVLVRRGRIIVEPISKIRGKHDLKKLVAKIPKNYRPGEIEWGPPQGKEVW